MSIEQQPTTSPKPPLAKRMLHSCKRIALTLLVIIGTPLLCYALWLPGKTVTDGRHDLGQNGIWMSHAWLGDDAWFARTGRDKNKYRDEAAIVQMVQQMKQQGMQDLFPHLCPCKTDGTIAAVDDEQVSRVLDQTEGMRVLPWVGGVNGEHCFLSDEAWRSQFVDSCMTLFEAHPRLAGVQVNIEPLPSGDPNFLLLLEALREAMPKGKILSVAAYPPPTRWHPFPDVHWDEAYFREVSSHVDQMAVMMYDTAISYDKPYRQLMCSWTREVLAWSGDTEVLLGVPTYDDVGSGYHVPEVENIEHALAGIHAGLAHEKTLPAHYRGVALYCNWEMDQAEWDYYQAHFRGE